MAVDDGLSEETIKRLMYLPESQMRRTYMQYKKETGKMPDSGMDGVNNK